jgi:hypothetical protein
MAKPMTPAAAKLTGMLSATPAVKLCFVRLSG